MQNDARRRVMNRGSPETVDTSSKRFRVIFASCCLLEHLFMSVAPAGRFSCDQAPSAVSVARRAAPREGQAPPALVSCRRGRRGLRGQGRPAGPSPEGRCAAPLRPEERPRILRAARPRPQARSASVNEGRRSRRLYCLCPSRGHGAFPSRTACSQATGDFMPSTECRRTWL